MASVYAIRGPDGLWFSRRDERAGVDVWASAVSLACKFGDAWSAQEYAVALCARNNGDFYSVYELDLTRRRLGRRW